MPEAKIIVIIYTTLYRKGGHQFSIVAKTLADEKREGGFGTEVICEAVESKSDVLKVFAEAKGAGKQISEFHFVGHSGMYGPMFASSPTSNTCTMCSLSIADAARASRKKRAVASSCFATPWVAIRPQLSLAIRILPQPFRCGCIQPA